MNTKGKRSGKRARKSLSKRRAVKSASIQRGVSRDAKLTQSPLPSQSSRDCSTVGMSEWYLLGLQAAKNLTALRKELETEMERRYLDAKYAEVKRLALEIGLKRSLYVIDVTAEEAKALTIKEP